MSFSINSNYNFWTQNNTNKSNQRGSFEEELKKAGIPENIISQGKDKVEEYAKAHGIQLPPPPDANNNNSSNNNSNSNSIFGNIGSDYSTLENTAAYQMNDTLKSYGIPKYIVDQGKEAVEAYAKQNNIQLPASPTQGSSLNIVS